MSSDLKTGQLNRKELDFIANNVETLTPEEMAKQLRRTVDVVKKKIAQLPKRQQLHAQSGAVEQLHASPTWAELKRILMASEQDYFETQWAAYVQQFSSGTDIMATDEMMIKDLIILDIYGNRAAAEIVNAKILINQVQKLIDKEREKSPEVRDQVSMQSWQEQVNSYRGSLKALTETHLSYQQRKDAKLDDLKATRKARFKELTESRQNIFGVLRELDDVRNRIRKGRMMEKVRIAAERVKQDWGQLTEYEDGTVDKPFLSPEGELNNECVQTETGPAEE